MRESDITRNFAFATIIITAVILHGSLYPYNFRVPLGPIGPFQALLETWNSPPTSFGDLVANILLYIPFGLFGVLALKTSRKILAITVAGLLLCTTVELT